MSSALETSRGWGCDGHGGTVPARTPDSPLDRPGSGWDRDLHARAVLTAPAGRPPRRLAGRGGRRRARRGRRAARYRRACPSSSTRHHDARRALPEARPLQPAVAASTAGTALRRRLRRLPRRGATRCSTPRRGCGARRRRAASLGVGRPVSDSLDHRAVEEVKAQVFDARFRPDRQPGGALVSAVGAQPRGPEMPPVSSTASAPSTPCATATTSRR